MSTSTANKQIERKYLIHLLDASFGGTTPNYVILGDDLEEFNEELNPDVEVRKNIRGQTRVVHSGYEVQSEAEPFYARYDEPLGEALLEIANERKTGDATKTTKVDVLTKEDGTVIWAYKEDVHVIPNSVGGDTSGVQIPFTIYNAGNRVKGTFDMDTMQFTQNSTSGGSGGSGEGT